jgi:hypothetical protein
MLSVIVSKVKEVFGIYLLWITLHWLSSELYGRLCIGRTVYEFLMSPFVAPMPHCVALRWVIYNGGKMIEVMWIVLGKWLIEQLAHYKYNEEKKCE